jgi:hypothetical protein
VRLVIAPSGSGGRSRRCLRLAREVRARGGVGAGKHVALAVGDMSRLLRLNIV